MSILRRARERLDRTGLLARILALVSLGLTIVLVGFVMLGTQSVRDSAERALQERSVTAELAARDLDGRLTALADLAAREGARLPTAGGERTEETRAAWHTLRLQLGRGVERVVAVGADGRLLWTSPYDEALLGLDLSQVALVRRGLAAEGPFIEPARPALPAQLLPQDSPALAVVSPLEPPASGLVLLLVDLADSGTVELLRHVAPGATGYAEVVDKGGMVLASTRPERVGRVGDPRGHLTALIDRQQAVVGTCHNCHAGDAGAPSEEDVLALAPLQSAPLAVALRQSSREAFAFGEAVFQRSLFLGAISFVLALAVTTLIVVRLLRPVKVLTGACRRIAEGDLAEPIPVLGGGEMSILAHSFETMRARLKESQEIIQAWGRELEAEVQERTAELQKARDELERSHDYLVTLLDSLEDQLAVIDKSYRVVEVNRALQRRHPGETSLVGEPCYYAFHGAYQPCEVDHHVCPAKTVWRTGQPSRVTQIYSDGTGGTYYLDIVASPITDSQGNILYVLEVARDITESKRLEDQVIRASEELSTLVSLSSAIACSMDLKAMLGVALDHVLNLLSADRGGILVYAIEGESPPVFVFRGLADEEVMRFVQDAHRPQDRLEIRRTQCRDADVLCVPIGTAERVLGDMFVCCPHKHWLSDAGLQLLVSIGSQLAVAIENARLYEAVRRKEEDISSFLRKYIAAQEDERKRIARELHDDTAQSLTALAMAIETAVQTPTDSAAEIRALLEPARALTDRISTEVSRIIRDLRPSLLDDLGLLEALGWYADNRLKPLGIQVTFETVGDGRRLSPELETGLFRVAQEAMSNIARHAEAENASITLEYGDDYVAVAVEDDGCGFDVEATLAKGKDGRDDSPFGLLGMRERVELMGGTLLVQSRPNQGTSITVRVPLAQS